MIKVGDKCNWLKSERDAVGVEVVLPPTGKGAAVVFRDTMGARALSVYWLPLSELTLVASAPVKEPSPDFDVLTEHLALGHMYADLKAENARLREALQMAVDTLDDDKWLRMRDGHSSILAAAAALGIRPKETP